MTYQSELKGRGRLCCPNSLIWIFPVLLQLTVMMMMMMMMNCFCGMVDWQKAFSLISSRDHCQRFSPSRISDTPRAGFEPVQNLSSGLAEWSCAVVITTTPRRHNRSAMGKPKMLWRKKNGTEEDLKNQQKNRKELGREQWQNGMQIWNQKELECK